MCHVCNLAIEAACSTWNRVNEMINISLLEGLIGTYFSIGIGFGLLFFISDINRKCGNGLVDRMVLPLCIVVFWFFIFIAFLLFIFDVIKDDTFKLGPVNELDEDEELI